MPPAVYRWAVTTGHGNSRFHVDARYAGTEPGGQMALYGPEGTPVFLAEPGTGCTFTRQARAENAAVVSLVSMLTAEEAAVANGVAEGKTSISDGRRALGLKPLAGDSEDDHDDAGCCGSGACCSSCG